MPISKWSPVKNAQVQMAAVMTDPPVFGGSVSMSLKCPEVTATEYT